MSEEKSAIDLIYDMHEMLLAMQSKINILEKNNNLLTDLLAKQAGGGPQVAIKGKEVVLAPIPPPVAVVQPATAAPAQVMPVITQAGPENKEQSTKVFGVLKATDGKLLHGLTVSMVDAKTNTVVKTTKTNRAGEFLSFLPTGKYIAVVTLENNQQKFKPFDLTKGAKEVEVSIV